MNTENASSPLINGSKNNKRWSTIQCLSFSFVVAALVGFFSNLDRIISSDDDSPSSPELKSIVELVTDRDDLTTLSSALTTANLIDTLNGDGPFTVFGPTNDAFDAITVPTNITTLTNILTYHVVDGDVLSTDLSNGLVVDTLNGDTITVFISEDGVFFYDSNGRISQVIDADLKGSNGVVHVVDSVLLPDGLLTDILSNIPFLSTLNAALIANGLDQVLSDPDGTFTVFAPTNDAIDAFTGTITSNVLLYHVLTDIYLSDDIPNKPTELTTASGEILTVVKMNNEVFITDAVGRIAQVSIANVAARNGVVHIIDILLAPTEFRRNNAQYQQKANDGETYSHHVSEGLGTMKVVSISVVGAVCLLIIAGLMMGLWCFCKGYNGKRNSGHITINDDEEEESLDEMDG